MSFLYEKGLEDVGYQGTRTGVPRSRTCGPHGIYIYIFIVFNLGILGDEITHKYQLCRNNIGISHDEVRSARGTSNYPLRLGSSCDRCDPGWLG